MYNLMWSQYNNGKQTINISYLDPDFLTKLDMNLQTFSSQKIADFSEQVTWGK